MTARLIVLAGSLCLDAPASAADAWVTIASDPPGASIYWTSPGPINQTEYAYGPAPKTIQVQLPKGHDCVETDAVRVRWVSGVEAGLPSLNVCKNEPGKNPIVFIRPSGIPGLETDARYALDLARFYLEERAIAQQHKDAAARTAVAALSALMPPAPVTVLIPGAPPLLPQPTVRCTSELVGTSVYTTCR